MIYLVYNRGPGGVEMNQSRKLVILLAAFCMVSLAGVQAGEVWDKTTIDTTGNVGLYASMAINATAGTNPWISYWDASNGNLKLAYIVDGAWQIVPIDESVNSVGKFSSIALGSIAGVDIPQISYYDASAQELKYAIMLFGIHNETVDSGGDVGMYSSICLDNNQYPIIAYYNATAHRLKMARDGGGGWGISTIDWGYQGSGPDHDVGQYCSVAWAGMGWDPGQGDGWVCSYYDATGHYLKFAHQGAVWVEAQVVDGSGVSDDVGQYSSVKVDSAGRAHISYYDATRSALMYASQDQYGGTNWDIVTVDNLGDVGKYTNLVLEYGYSGPAHPRISYYDDTNKRIKYAWSDDGVNWHKAYIDDVVGGQQTAVALDRWGNPHLAYYTFNGQDLKFAEQMLVAENIGIFRPSNIRWYLDYGYPPDGSSNYQVNWGESTDVPITGDWDNDGLDEIGLWRPSTARWYLDYDNNGMSNFQVTWGESTDIPITGDWDADGYDEIGLWRPSNVRWYLDYDNNGLSDYKVYWGAAGDKPLTGDWDRDGYDEIGLWRPSTARWYLDYDNNGMSNFQVTWGESTDVPITGDWDADGYDEIGLFRPSNVRWYLDYNNNGQSDYKVYWGAATDKPLTGTWT